MRALRWRVLCMREQICELCLPSLLHQLTLQFFSIMLDDVLAALDSHVAKHVFGKWPFKRG